MPHQFFTAEDIRQFAREKTEPLVLRHDDILTHEAADIAYALGVKIVRETGSSRGVKKDATSAISNQQPLKVVHLSNVQVEPFLEAASTAGTNIWHKNVIGPQDSSPMNIGYMSLDKGEMKRTQPHDEIDIVLEGELVITRGVEQVRGKAGDVICIPKGSDITLGTPNWTRFVYVVLPMNRNEK